MHTVEFYSPSKGGMQEVVRQISERLLSRGHQVTVATTVDPKRTASAINGVQIQDFAIRGNCVSGLVGDVSSYQQFVIGGEFDIVTNFAAQQWATDALLPVLEQIPAKKVLVPTGFSALHAKNYRNYFNNMKAWMQKYDSNVFSSNSYQDVIFARQNGVEKITIIPNGADEREFGELSAIDFRKQWNISNDSFLILSVGSHTGAKGHKEAIDIFRKAEIKNAVFILIGNKLNEKCYRSCTQAAAYFTTNKGQRRLGKRLIVVDVPRHEVVAAYQHADLFLFPSNVECSPIVLFECMASRTPFLVTDVGNAAEIIEWSEAGELLTTKKKKGRSYANIADSVKQLESIYDDAKKRADMAERGYRAWQQSFTWEKIAEKYEQLYFT